MNPWIARGLFLAAGMAIGVLMARGACGMCCLRHKATMHALLDCYRAAQNIDEEGDW